MSTTHVAGIAIGIKSEDIFIQRCALCGYVLQDLRPSRIMVQGSDDRGLPEFAVGGLYQITEGNPTSFIHLGDFAKVDELPSDFCLPLVERETR